VVEVRKKKHFDFKESDSNRNAAADPIKRLEI
jgi:hypothetical protein